MFVELHARSAFSFLEGASLPEEMVSTCARFGMPAMALLDTDGVYGAPRFHLAADKAKIKAHIEKFELSGHADREELLEFSVQAAPRSIVLTHGEPAARAWFAAELAKQLPKTKILDPLPLKPYQV